MFRIRKIGRLHFNYTVTLDMCQNPAGIDPAVRRANGPYYTGFFYGHVISYLYIYF